MANQGVNPTALTLNDGVAAPAGVTITAANTAVITAASLSGDATGGAHQGRDQVELSRVVLVLTQGGTGSSTVTVKAGANPPANRKILGDKAISLSTSQVKYVVLEAANYTQADGTVKLVVATNDVKVAVLKLPKGL